MRRFIFLFLAVSMASISVPALQAETPVKIGFGIGPSFGGFREETDSEINRYYTNLTYLLYANMEFGHFLHSFNLSFNMGETTAAAKFENKYVYDWVYSFYRGTFDYALDYRLWNIMGNSSLPGYLGGIFRTDFSLITALEVPKITALMSLGLHVTQKWLIDSKQSLTFSASIPLFTYAVRPPFPGADEILAKFVGEGRPLMFLTTGRFASVHNYWALHGNLKYHFRLIEQLSLYAGLGFELSHINFTAPRRDAVTRLSGGLTFTF